jgi:hypothetical protein
MPRMPDASSEPEWMQRMRAAGYDLRRDDEPGPLSEIPDAVFTPPPAREKVRGYASMIRGWFHRARPSHPRQGHAPVP